MPVNFKIKQRSVVLNKQTKPLIQSFKQALEKHTLTHASREDDNAAQLSPGKNTLRSGIWARYITSSIERISDSALSGHEVTLLPLSTELDVPAKILLEGYIDFLNRLLSTQGVGSEEAESKEIKSPHVLLRELLIRLVSWMLDNQLDKEHDGDVLLKVLNDFIVDCIDEGSFFKKPLIGETKVTPFLRRLAKEHPEWIQQFRKMVDIVTAMHSHERSVSKAIESLKRAENAMKAQLVAYLDDKTKGSDLHPFWVNTTLAQLEQKLLEQSVVSDDNASAVIAQEDIGISVISKAYLLSMMSARKFSEPRQDKIIKLYEQLNANDYFQQIMAYLDLLITTTGWMPILVGVIDFSKLAQLLTEHGHQCAQVLTIPSSLSSLIENTSVEAGLIRYEAIEGRTVGQLASVAAMDLAQLDNPHLKRQIGNLIGHTVSSLLSLQQQLPIAYQFLHADRLVSLQQTLPRHHAIGERSAAEEIKRLQLAIDQQEREYAQLMSAQAGVVDTSSFNKQATLLLIQMIQKRVKDTTVFSLLHQQGANLTAPYLAEAGFFVGMTPLHIAAAVGNQSACEWLLAREVDVNIRDARKKQTPLDKACLAHHGELIAFLRSRGGKSEIQDEFTAKLHALLTNSEITNADDSVTAEHKRGLSDFFYRGADINGINQETGPWRGLTPLHILLEKGNQCLITLFMANNADPTLRTTTGNDNEGGETAYERLKRIAPESQTIAFLAGEFPEQFPEAVRDQQTKMMSSADSRSTGQTGRSSASALLKGLVSTPKSEPRRDTAMGRESNTRPVAQPKR